MALHLVITYIFNIAMDHYIIISFCAYIIYYLWINILSVYLRVQYYHSQAPKETIPLFYPLIGKAFFHNQRSFNENDDSHRWFKDQILQNPNLKATISVVGRKPVIQLTDVELVKEFVQKDALIFRRSHQIPQLDNLLGMGIIFCDNEKWKSQRKYCSSFFHMNTLAQNLQLICELTKNSINQMKLGAGGKPNEEIPMYCIKLGERLAGDILASIFFGTDISNQILNGKPITIEMSNIITDMVDYSTRNLWVKIKQSVLGVELAEKMFVSNQEKQLYNRLHNLKQLAYKIIEKRMNQYECGNKGSNNFLDNYLKLYYQQQDSKITLEEIVQQFITFFFCGTDTTGHLIGMSLYLMAAEPEIRQNIIKEVNTVIKDLKNITINTLNQLKYTTSFLKECLRKFTPSGWIMPREALENTTIGPFKIFSGDLVSVNLLAIMMNPKYYDNPEQFSVERWMDNTKPLSDQFAYTPFSAGHKNCLGQYLAMMEAKVILIHYLQHFEFKPIQSKKIRMLQKLFYEPCDELIYVTEKK